MPASLLETYKAQAQVLVPVVRELISELGEARAQAIVRKALGDHFRTLGKQAFDAMEGPSFGNKMHSLVQAFAQDDALDWTQDGQSGDEFRFTVTGCRYAEFYKALGAPELGFMLVCSQDYRMNEGIDDRAVLERPTTIMQGHSQCSFKWYLARDKDEAARKRAAEEQTHDVWKPASRPQGGT